MEINEGVEHLYPKDLFYILENRTPIPESDLSKWSQWMRENDSHVAENLIKLDNRTVWVSTVFLGIEHGFSGRSVLFETMVFNESGLSRLSLAQWRWHTWDEAEKGHERICESIRSKEISFEI